MGMHGVRNILTYGGPLAFFATEGLLCFWLGKNKVKKLRTGILRGAVGLARLQTTDLDIVSKIC